MISAGPWNMNQSDTYHMVWQGWSLHHTFLLHRQHTEVLVTESRTQPYNFDTVLTHYDRHRTCLAHKVCTMWCLMRSRTQRHSSSMVLLLFHRYQPVPQHISGRPQKHCQHMYHWDTLSKALKADYQYQLLLQHTEHIRVHVEHYKIQEYTRGKQLMHPYRHLQCHWRTARR
jgi:hypothetical protein